MTKQNTDKNVTESKEKAREIVEELTVQQIIALPDWEKDGVVGNLVELIKNVDGKREIFTVRVYYDKETKKELVPELRFVPPTGMKIGDLKINPRPLTQVFNDLRKRIDDFLYLTDDIHYDLATLGAISSYFREVFNTYPYFDFYSAEPGTGKTTAMRCMVYTSFNGFTMGSLTKAVLFRMVEDIRGAVGIDQIDSYFYTEKGGQVRCTDPELYGLLDSGHSKGLPAYRMKKMGEDYFPFGYDPFGLKVLTRIKEIPLTLLSRCISINMIKNVGFKTIKKEIPTPTDFEDLRGELYLYRIMHHQDVKEAYDQVLKETKLMGRTKDLFVPLLTVAKLIDKGLFDRVLKYAKEFGKVKDVGTQDTRLVALLEVLNNNNLIGIQKVADIRDVLNNKLILIGEITTEYKYSSQTIMKWLNRLGFNKSPLRTDGYAYYDIPHDRLSQLVKSYTTQIEEEKSKDSVLPGSSFSSSSSFSMDGHGLQKNEDNELNELPQSTLYKCSKCQNTSELGLPHDVILNTVSCPMCKEQGTLARVAQIGLSKNEQKVLAIIEQWQPTHADLLKTFKDLKSEDLDVIIKHLLDLKLIETWTDDKQLLHYRVKIKLADYGA